MSTDLSQFFQLFFEESAEHLAEMERIFLSIDPDNPDDEELNAVFRAAHSIKGGAATFGFPDMAEVTHILETLLDRVRNRELRLSREMIDICLAAGDGIESQLAGHRDGAEVNLEQIETVRSRLSAIIGGAKGPVTTKEQPADAPAPHSVEATYRIVYNPQPDFFMRRVRMEPLLEELAALGELTVVARIDAPDSLDGYDPMCCRISWEMSIITTHQLEELRDIFLFVADEEDMSFEMVPPAPSGPDQEPELQPGAAAISGERLQASGTPAGRRQYDCEESTPGAFGRRSTDNRESSTIRVGVPKVDQLINQVGELVITQAMLAQTAQGLDPVLYEHLHRGLMLLERNTRDLQESVMSIRMMPISSIFNRFPRLVRDLAAKLNKQVELKLVGETTELDKGLIEKLADPLTHLVRNSLDHGIESPEVRRRNGKPPCGTVTLRASQQGGRVVLEVSDDGGGLNRARIVKKAIDNGLPASEGMSDEEVWQLIFAPGFSTAEQVTDVSGRGVGMDVVLRNVNHLGGRIAIFSEENKGSRVVISLPLTLAILDGLSVRVGDETFIVPLNSIIESLQPRSVDLNTVGGTQCTVHVRGDHLPLMYLKDLFCIPGAVTRPEEGVVMLVDAEGEKVALLVDELLGEHQVVIKSLEANFRKVNGTAGATILGDGKVAMILDVAGLIRLWRGRPSDA
jgi:two-component system chemotaxis sensor kinase CheA